MNTRLFLILFAASLALAQVPAGPLNPVTTLPAAASAIVGQIYAFKGSSSCTAGAGSGTTPVVHCVTYDGSTWTTLGSGAGTVASVFGRTGTITSQSGDYTAAQVTNAVDQTGTYSNPGWITALANAKITGLTSFATLAPGASTTWVRGDSSLQTANAANGPVVLDGSGNAAIAITVLGPKTIGAGANQLPAASTVARGLSIITDGASASDCTAGGGSTVVPCFSNGTVWGALGSSSGTAWGTITGTLSSQSDLSAALAAKAPLASPTFTGTVGGITATMVGLGSVTNDAQTKASIVPNSAPSAGQILAGNAGGTAYAPVGITGACTMTSLGVFTCTPPWSSLANPSGNLSLSMGANTSTFTWGNATGANSLFALTDSASNTGTGALVELNSATGSALSYILRINKAGSGVFLVNKNGDLNSSGALTFAGPAQAQYFSVSADNLALVPVSPINESSGTKAWEAYSAATGYARQTIASSFCATPANTFPAVACNAQLKNDGTLLMTSTATKYNNLSTAGLGLPPIYAAVASTGNTSSIGATNLQCGGAVCAAGMYRIHVYSLVTATGAGTLTVTIGWQDAAAVRTFTTSGVATTATNFEQADVVAVADGIHNLTYLTTLSSSGTYSEYITLERLQ